MREKSLAKRMWISGGKTDCMKARKKAKAPKREANEVQYSFMFDF